MSFHSGRCPASIFSRMGPISWSFSCSLLTAAGSQLAAATAAIPCTCLTSARASNLWRWLYSSWQGPREKASTFLCFRPWRCSEVKFYSCTLWIHRAVCHCRFLKLISQVTTEWSVRRWNSCLYRYLWKYSSVLTIASRARTLVIDVGTLHICITSSHAINICRFGICAE
jgi:hypothetical protein